MRKIFRFASFLLMKNEGETLEVFLNSKVFADASASVINPDKENVEGFNKYIEEYKKLLKVEQTAVEVL